MGEQTLVTGSLYTPIYKHSPPAAIYTYIYIYIYTHTYIHKTYMVITITELARKNPATYATIFFYRNHYPHSVTATSLLWGLLWFHTTDSWISRSFLFFPTHSRHALSFFTLMQTEGSLRIKHSAFIHSELSSTGNRCPQSSVCVRLMIQPLTSEAKATALLQIGPLKDFIF